MKLKTLLISPLFLSLATCLNATELASDTPSPGHHGQLLLARREAIANNLNLLYDRNTRADRQRQDRREYYRSRLQTRNSCSKCQPTEDQAIDDTVSEQPPTQSDTTHVV